MFLLLAACASAPTDSAEPAAPVPWSHTRAPLSEVAPDGRAVRRAIVHLHSPLSHDACDNHEMEDAPCLADLRAGLCDAAIDFAFFTDHPAEAAFSPYDGLFQAQEGDEPVDGVASRLHCEGGTEVLWMAGIEDELMPVGLDRHVSEDAAENDRIYNATEAETFEAEIAAGGVVLQAHTEGQDLDTLLARQALGLHGVELFNLHAMVDPNKREDDLGLGAFDYLTAAAPFIQMVTDAEPDLVFLAFYEEQAVSLERWDALSAVAPTLGTAGTDAHENALPMLMADGERVDSYRRMLSWFANYLVVADDTPAAAEAALRERSSYVVFDALGVPTGFSVRYGDSAWSVAGAPVGEELVVACPTLAPTSPTDLSAPVITATVFKDGAVWATGCGAHPIDAPGVYRVRVDIVPEHLRGALGDQADTLVHTYPWVYSQAFAVGVGAAAD